MALDCGLHSRSLLSSLESYMQPEALVRIVPDIHHRLSVSSYVKTSEKLGEWNEKVTQSDL